jgi:hypothetical protein
MYIHTLEGAIKEFRYFETTLIVELTLIGMSY